MLDLACTRCATLSALALILCGSAVFAAEPRQADPADIPTHTAEPVQAEPLDSEPKLLGNPGGRNCPGDPQACDPHGIKFAFSGGTFWIAEGEYAANGGNGAARLPGSYKLGAWHETGNFPNRFTGAFDRRGNWGVYAVADQAVWRRPGSEEQGLNVFLRIGGAPSDRNFISFYADAGIGFRAPFVSRPDDVVTLGAAFGKVSAEAARADRSSGPPIPARDHEAIIELSYAASVIPGWSVQPDLQYVMHPGGSVRSPNRPGAIPNALVLGLRTTLAF